MSAAKSKKRKGKNRAAQKPLESLRQKLASGPTQGLPVVIEPKGKVKMSEVLETLVEPYLDACETADDYRKLYNLGALAWNAAFLPAVGQAEMIEQVLGGGLPANAKAELAAVVRALVARKQALFADNTRKIVKVELTETARGLHLSVASTL